MKTNWDCLTLRRYLTRLVLAYAEFEFTREQAGLETRREKAIQGLVTELEVLLGYVVDNVT